ATDYIRTPQFPKRVHQNGAGIGDALGVSGPAANRRRQKTQEINDDDWDTIRKFQTTDLKKSEGIQASIDEIRKFLNKITEKTYDKMFPQICSEIDKIVGCSIEDMSKIGESIFTIASGNTFYSNMYAKMYKELMEKYPVMKTIFSENFKQFSNLFTMIEYCSPNEDYDKFCENNKKNNNRRALGMFYINLMKEGVIKNDDMIDIIKNVQVSFLEKISEPGNRDIADELSENLYIFITKSHSHLEDEDDWDDIITKVEEIANYKTSDYPSITNKAVFKHMDIVDEI
ncbi:MAG: hypothetical protein WD512_18365, partial [Candidatus Paceibacterota bacterium]